MSERENTDNQRETALQTYIDNISTLLLDKKLRESGEDDEVRKIARVRTLTVLPRLDDKRKVSVLQFLLEAGLVQKDKKIIDLQGVDLSGVDFFKANFRGVDLSGANFSGAGFFEADFSQANLSGANFSQANLSFGDFRGANFRGADLIFAHLEGAFITGADFSGAKYLEEVMKKAKSFNELDEWYDKHGRPDKNDANIAGDD